MGWGWSSPVVAQGRVHVTDAELMRLNCRELVHCFDAAGPGYLSAQVFALCQAANRPIQVVVAVRHRFVQLRVSSERRVDIHEQQGKTFFPVGNILVAKVSVLGFGEAWHDRFF